MVTVTYRPNPGFFDDLDPVIQAKMWAAVYFAESYAKSNHPYTDQTGNLTRSIAGHVEGRGRNTVGYLVATMPYAAFVELGTRYMAARPYLRPAMRALERKRL